jgi:hypothetical protein
MLNIRMTVTGSLENLPAKIQPRPGVLTTRTRPALSASHKTKRITIEATL